MNKYAIITNAHGERYKRLSMFTTPLSSRYAASIGVDFLAFSEAPEDRHPADTDAFFVSRQNIFNLIDDDCFFICQKDTYLPDPRGEMAEWTSLVPSQEHIKMVREQNWYKKMPNHALEMFESQPACRVRFHSDGGSQLNVKDDPFVSAEWLAAICCLTSINPADLRELCKSPFFINSGLFLLKNCEKSFDFLNECIMNYCI